MFSRTFAQSLTSTLESFVVQLPFNQVCALSPRKGASSRARETRRLYILCIPSGASYAPMLQGRDCDQVLLYTYVQYIYASALTERFQSGRIEASCLRSWRC